jgi:hypothetical protein
MDKYYPSGDKTDQQNVYGHAIAAITVQMLRQCGDELIRENVMKQVASLPFCCARSASALTAES